MATVDDKKIIFSMVGVSKTIQQNQKQVLKNIYLSFFYGAKIGIIGLNGAGKSTLMKIIAGLDQQYQGNVVWSPGYSVGYLPQDPPLNEEKTVKENVMEGVQHVYDALAEYDEINAKFGLPEYYEDPDKMDQLMQRQAELQDIIDATDAWNMDSKLERAMAALGCPPGDWSVKTLSGGERRRVALCKLLLQKPDVLLLDEPTNHLDAESIDWLEQHLQQYEGTVIAVTHDRYFLDDVAEWILELDRGEGIPWKGNYSSWLEQQSAECHTATLTAREVLHAPVAWGTVQCSHRTIELRVHVPGVSSVDHILQLRLARHEFLHLIRVFVVFGQAKLDIDVIIFCQSIVHMLYALHHILLHCLLFVERGILRQIAYGVAWAPNDVALILLVESGDNLHQCRLTCAIQTDDTYFRTIKETEVDVLEHLLLILLNGLAHSHHREYHFLVVNCCHNFGLLGVINTSFYGAKIQKRRQSEAKIIFF